MLELLGLFLSTWAFGPVGGTAYAVAHGFSNLETIVIIALINIVVVVIWFGIIGFVEKRFRHFLDRYEKRGVKIPFMTSRKRTRNSVTLGLGLMVLSFIGSVWAVIAAHVANADKRLAWAVITPSAVVGAVFWTLGSLGILPFLPSPWWLYVIAVGSTVVLFIVKVCQNFGLIREAIRQIRGGGSGEKKG